MCLITELPYHSDSSLLFNAIADRPWAVFLDSGHPLSHGGRYDILAADPYKTLCTFGATTEVTDQKGTVSSEEDPFVLLREALGEKSAPSTELPFCGGAIGWFGYDLGRRIEMLPSLAMDKENLPDMAVGIYDWSVVVDHQQQRSWLVAQGRVASTKRRWWQLLKLFKSVTPSCSLPPFNVTGEVVSNLSKSAYATAFARIKDYIRNGDCYQVNFAQRFSAPAEGDGWHAYRRLRELNPAPFSAFMRTPYGQALSSSPERLLELRDTQVETKPIKGTRPRSATPEADSALAQELANSRKDQAENLMIVDLLRNDISRVCKPGSVKVPKLFDIESYATVHHMVSTVRGELETDKDACDLLQACFPGGSITGAPKIRAMEIIEELEPQRRGLYCGSIGYIGFDGQMDTNITIRTLVYNQGEVRCWAGGGIVHDSKMEAEYQETFDKAAAMLRLLQTQACADVGA